MASNTASVIESLSPFIQSSMFSTSISAKSNSLNISTIVWCNMFVTLTSNEPSHLTHAWNILVGNIIDNAIKLAFIHITHSLIDFLLSYSPSYSS